jgi:hypothetical protein
LSVRRRDGYLPARSGRQGERDVIDWHRRAKERRRKASQHESLNQREERCDEAMATKVNCSDAIHGVGTFPSTGVSTWFKSRYVVLPVNLFMTRGYNES